MAMKFLFWIDLELFMNMIFGGVKWLDWTLNLNVSLMTCVIVTIQAVVIDTHTNSSMVELLLQPKLDNLIKYYVFKDTKADLNDNKNRGLNR